MRAEGTRGAALFRRQKRAVGCGSCSHSGARGHSLHGWRSSRPTSAEALLAPCLPPQDYGWFRSRWRGFDLGDETSSGSGHAKVAAGKVHAGENRSYQETLVHRHPRHRLREPLRLRSSLPHDSQSAQPAASLARLTRAHEPEMKTTDLYEAL